MRISQAGWGAPNKRGGYKISLKIDFFFQKRGSSVFGKHSHILREKNLKTLRKQNANRKQPHKIDFFVEN